MLDKKDNTLVVSGFPGVGKSYFAGKERYREGNHKLITLDADSSSFDKGGFPLNYISHIKSKLGKVDILFVSSDWEVRKSLVNNGIFFTLVYPNKSLKIEYLKRYAERGDSDEFINSLLSKWNVWLDELGNQNGCVHLVLNSGEYLWDKLNV